MFSAFYGKLSRWFGQHGVIVYRPTPLSYDEPSLCRFMIPTDWNDPELVS